MGSVDHRLNAALHSAVLTAPTVTVTWPLAHRADVGRRNAHRWIALDLAAISGERVIASVLLQYGAQPAACTGAMLGSTRFPNAVMEGHVSVVGSSWPRRDKCSAEGCNCGSWRWARSDFQVAVWCCRGCNSSELPGDAIYSGSGN